MKKNKIFPKAINSNTIPYKDFTVSLNSISVDSYNGNTIELNRTDLISIEFTELIKAFSLNDSYELKNLLIDLSYKLYNHKDDDDNYNVVVNLINEIENLYAFEAYVLRNQIKIQNEKDYEKEYQEWFKEQYDEEYSEK